MGESFGMSTARDDVIVDKLRYVYEDKDRHGNVRIYFWRGAGHRKIRIKEEPGTQAFRDAYSAAWKMETRKGVNLPAVIEDKPRAVTIIPPQAGTFRWLCTKYFASGDFKRLDPTTQKRRRSILEACFEEPVAPDEEAIFADFPLKRMTRTAIKVLRDRKSEFPEAANGRVKAIRQVYRWALDEDDIPVDRNIAADVSYIRTASEGFHSWTPAEVERFEEFYPVGTVARLAFSLLLYTGVRRSDVVLFGKQHVQRGTIQIDGEDVPCSWLHFTAFKGRNKKPITLDIPILPVLQEVIDASPIGDLTFIINEYGRPFTAASFGNRMRKWCDAAGLPECSAHGLRKAGATRAAENGASEYTLMAMFGWMTPKEAARYTRAARQKRLAAAGMPLLIGR